METTIFLKLGGSLLTDKTGVEALRQDALARLAAEIAAARLAQPSLRLVLGHGSGSFGHVAAAKHGTRDSVDGSEQWQGFAEVSDAAARLNRAVVGALLAAGVPAVTLQASAGAICVDGLIVQLGLERTIFRALDAGLVPVIYGDVAFDAARGGTIISTEEIMIALAKEVHPQWLLLAGETAGVLDESAAVVPQIQEESYEAILPALGGSRGTDVTGGMAGKVRQMLDLAGNNPGLAVRIFSGLEPGNLEAALLDPERMMGTVIRS